ncbi:MAG: hypothetical protein H8E31_03795 [Planctomycetes bacterium]|nr:hypothetical protein [Planctomycetota bacterium]
MDRLPFRFFYADTRLQTKHLVEILRKYIATADMCFFDVSTWNPNVALELGLAEGMGVEYYILLNRNLSKGVPSDIQGIQRIEYANYQDTDSDGGLLPLLVKYLMMEHTHPRRIWDSMESEPNRDRLFLLSLRVLAHFKDHKRLTSDQLTNLSRGTYIRKADREALLEQLDSLGLLGNIKSRYGATLKKNLYREPIQ